MDFLDLAKARYSVRKLDDTRPVEEEKLARIIEAGRVAPTAHNFQPVTVWIIRKKEDLEKVCETTPNTFVRDVSTVLVVGGDPNVAWVREYDDKNFVDVDAAIVATHMMLEIHDLGLGSTWIGKFDEAKLKEYFPQMKDHNLIAMFPVAYPAEDAHPSRLHADVKPTEEFAKEI